MPRQRKWKRELVALDGTATFVGSGQDRHPKQTLTFSLRN